MRTQTKIQRNNFSPILDINFQLEEYADGEIENIEMKIVFEDDVLLSPLSHEEIVQLLEFFVLARLEETNEYEYDDAVSELDRLVEEDVSLQEIFEYYRAVLDEHPLVSRLVVNIAAGAFRMSEILGYEEEISDGMAGLMVEFFGCVPDDAWKEVVVVLMRAAINLAPE